MTATFAIVFNKEGRKNKSGLFSLFIRITLRQKVRYIRLDQKIAEQYWSGKEGRWVKESHPLAFQINSLIRKRLNEIQEHEIKLRLGGRTVTLEGLVDVLERKFNPTILNSFIEAMIPKIRGKNPRTISQYKLMLKSLNEFNKNIFMTDLNETLLQKFADFLQYENNLMYKTVDKRIRIFTMFVGFAVKDGLLETDPFVKAKIKLKPDDAKRVYLTVDEIKKVRDVVVEGRLGLARELWLFCFYAGFYYNDLRKLQWSQIEQTKSGPMIIKGRDKNNQEYCTPIFKFKHAVEILERQRGMHDTLVFTRTISEQKLNKYIKEVVIKAGINKLINIRSARHSFTQFWKRLGHDSAHVSKMLGHTKQATTEIYYKLDPNDVAAAVDKFNFDEIGF